MQTFVNNSVEQQKASKGEWLHQLPPELVGVLPQNIWISLGLDQKKDILRQHNLLDKYNNSEVPAQEISSPELPQVIGGVEKPEVIEAPKSDVPEVLTADKGMVSEQEQFAKTVETMKAKEEVVKNETPAAVEDKPRVATEQADSASKKNNIKTSVGYKINDKTVTDAVSISEHGNTDDGRVWAAALVRKIFAIVD